MLPLDEFSRGSYISENALLPGQVEAYFGGSELNIIRAYRKEVESWALSEDPELCVSPSEGILGADLEDTWLNSKEYLRGFDSKLDDSIIICLQKMLGLQSMGPISTEYCELQEEMRPRRSFCRLVGEQVTVASTSVESLC